MIRTFRLFLFAALGASLTVTDSLRAAIPAAENLLPSDTLFVVTAPDCTTLRSTMNQSPQWLLWNDPAMKPFHDKFIGKWNESFVAPVEKDLGVKLADFKDLPQGQFTFAVTQNGWDGTGDQSPGLILLVDAKDKSDLLKTNLAALQKKWNDDGKPLRSETIRGIQFSIVPLSSNDIPASLSGIFPKRQPVSELGKETPPARPGELVIGQFESLLIVGNSVKAVEPVVAHLTGSSAPALNDNAIFAADKLARFRDSPLYYGWFNAKTFFNVLDGIPQPEPNPDAPSPMPQFSWSKALIAFGAAGLKSASFAARESHDGSEMDFFLSAPENDRTGLFKIIAAATKDSSAPPFVPADAVKFWRWRVDGQKGWIALETMLGNISPAALSSLNAVIAMANAGAQLNDPGFDLRKNLIGNLGDDFISYQKAPAGSSIADMNSAPSIFLFAATNPEQAILAVKNVMSLMYGQHSTEPRDFLGKKIYGISLPAARLPGGATAPVSRSIYLTTSSGYLAISTDSSILEGFLRSVGSPVKPLGETAGLAEAAQHIGGTGGGLFGYENQREIMRSAFTLLKNQSTSNGGINAMAAVPIGVRDWMDFSLLPDYDHVSKYFFFSVFNGTTTPDGLSFKAFAPRPPQLN
ncbi:MAG TPA: hypothetical protein VHY30_03875 [Verrucomicrobiae bacterium]|jgi:hypothetical protein|nr:hypothetical protein [Verrucomicrobiae bacterium]